MVEEKKFLDAAGVKYLYDLLNIQDYPNNQDLVNVINAIDETKADKSLIFKYTIAPSEWGGSLNINGENYKYVVKNFKEDYIIGETNADYITCGLDTESLNINQFKEMLDSDFRLYSFDNNAHSFTFAIKSEYNPTTNFNIVITATNGEIGNI